MAAAGTPVICSAYSSVYGSTWALYSSKPCDEWAMKSLLCRSAAMISRPTALAIATSVPTFNPSQASANLADDVRRGSTLYIVAPLSSPFRT